MRYIVYPVLEVDGWWTTSDEQLGRVWGMMIDEGKVETVFHDGRIRSVSEFIEYMKSPATHPVLVYDRQRDDWGAIAWLNNMDSGNTQSHFCTFKGSNPILMGHTVMEYWGGTRGKDGELLFFNIIGIIPENNQRAVKYIQKLGFTTIGTIPDFCDLFFEDTRCGGVVSYYQPKEVT